MMTEVIFKLLFIFICIISVPTAMVLLTYGIFRFLKDDYPVEEKEETPAFCEQFKEHVEEVTEETPEVVSGPIEEIKEVKTTFRNKGKIKEKNKGKYKGKRFIGGKK